VFRLAPVPTEKELQDRAFRKAARVTIRGGRKGPERARALAASQIRTAAASLESILRSVVRSFPSLDRLAPFPRELVDALVGIDGVRKHLGALEWAADQIRRIAATYLREVGAASPPDARRFRREAFGRFGSLVARVGSDLEALGTARAKLRRIPDIDTALPTIIVAGAPNVGKSAFVRAVSSGRPKVAPYPFTTQGLEVGHFDRGARRYQVVDTPGLLDRPLERRNPIERQAVAALRYVAHVIVFLLDPSETCGTPLADQERLLASLATAFPETPVLVVENKVDLFRSGSTRPKVSALTGKGMTRVIAAATAALTSRVPEGDPRAGSG